MGQLEDDLDAGLTLVRRIAVVAHEANRALCRTHGDVSQPPWGTAPSWQQQSAMNGVRFHLNNPGATASASHENWLIEKINAGWVWGPEKDPDATPPTHPCLVGFQQLPEHQQARHRLFKAIVDALARDER